MSAFFRQFFGGAHFAHYHFLCGECRISRDIKKGRGIFPGPFNIKSSGNYFHLIPTANVH